MKCFSQGLTKGCCQNWDLKLPSLASTMGLFPLCCAHLFYHDLYQASRTARLPLPERCEEGRGREKTAWLEGILAPGEALHSGTQSLLETHWHHLAPGCSSGTGTITASPVPCSPDRSSTWKENVCQTCSSRDCPFPPEYMGKGGQCCTLRNNSAL